MDLNNIIATFSNLNFSNLKVVFSSLTNLITFETFLKGLALYFFIFWIATIIWVIKDIINRTNNIFLQILSISTVLFLTPLGVVIYLLIRPSKTLLEKYYEQGNFESIDKEFIESEEENQDETKKNSDLKCFSCGFPISDDFYFCPNCKIPLKKECSKCHKKLNAERKICPYCGNEEKTNEDKLSNNLQQENNIKKDSKKEEIAIGD